MRVALVTGSYPPEVCGVGDYSDCLAAALQQVGVDVQVFTGGPGWGLVDTPSWQRRIANWRPDVVHIQYPTVGYGKGLAPQALSLLPTPFPTVVTLHEFSQAHLLRRVATLAFCLRSSALIFTTDFERQAFRGWAPSTYSRAHIIPIGSNIPFSTADGSRDPNEVLHFGLIRPNRGLEEFLELARLSSECQAPYRFVIIGSADERHMAYLDELRGRAAGLPVEWMLSLPGHAVAERLSLGTFSYLPFPDGASDRRGSLLAALGNQLVVLTTRGQHTPCGLSEVAAFVSDPKAAFEMLDTLGQDVDRRTDMSRRGGRFAQRYSWEYIASQHVAVYEGVTRSRTV